MGSLGLWLGILEGLIRRQHPSYLVYFVTSRCNCRCPMCFNWENVSKATARDELQLDEIHLLAQSMKPLPQLLLSGGEPFLRQDLAEIISLFYTQAATRQVSIPTNGLLTQSIVDTVSEMLDRCPKAYFNINLALDGIGSDHDLSRGVPGCFDKVEQTFRGLEPIRRRNKRLTLNMITIIKKDNADRALELITTVKQRFNPNYHSVGLVRGNVQADEKQFDMDSLETTLDSLYSTKRAFSRLPFAHRTVSSIYSLMWNTLRTARRTEQRCFTCLAGKKIVVLSPEGLILPCEPLWLEPDVRQGHNAEEFIMARLQDFDFDLARALASEQAHKVKRFVAAQKCWCLYGCAVYNSILYSPGMYPKLLREIVRPGR